MLQPSTKKALEELVRQSTKEELIWINGYLSGLVSDNASAPTTNQSTAAAATAVKKISLVYGTETGNAKSLSEKLAASAKKNGVHAKLTGLDQYRLTDLEKEEYLFVVISTQGEGEPPIGAKKFYDHIYAQQPSLAKLKYSVLALGDSSYPQFCKTGDDVDARFEQLGGKRVVPIQRCDVDYEADADKWFAEVVKSLQVPASSNNVASPATTTIVAKKPAGKKYYAGTIQANIDLNDIGSTKHTYHIEIATDEVIEYEPGDTIGIVPRNRENVVSKIVELTGIDRSKVLETAKATASVEELLTVNLSICYLLSSTIKKYAALTGQEIPDTRMDLVDLLRIYPVKDAAQFEEVIKFLMPIAPRLYSVASSPIAHGEQEVHITVARDRFLAEDEQRYGLCSEFLGDLPIGSSLHFYVHKDKSFKLPAGDKNVIMVGPGTGVAPFRAFLAERDAKGDTGKNWFFFGNQHFVNDFLYQSEIQQLVKTGVLNRIDLAFSRDQQEKIYVQHRMQQHASDLYKWIDEGASFYISGTKDPMSKDVEDTLLSIISTEGNKTSEEAKKYVEQMKKEGRYAKDVY